MSDAVPDGSTAPGPVRLSVLRSAQCRFESDWGHTKPQLRGHLPGRYCPESGRRPQCVRSRFGHRVESIRNPPQIIGEQVPVTVRGERRRLVAQQGLQHLHIGPAEIARDAQVCRRSCGVMTGNSGVTAWRFSSISSRRWAAVVARTVCTAGSNTQ